MAYDTANTYETIELFGLTEKDAQLPIPEDHVLTDHIVRESFEALLGQLRGTGLAHRGREHRDPAHLSRPFGRGHTNHPRPR